jgi:hypothetical protein
MQPALTVEVDIGDWIFCVGRRLQVCEVTGFFHELIRAMDGHVLLLVAAHQVIYIGKTEAEAMAARDRYTAIYATWSREMKQRERYVAAAQRVSNLLNDWVCREAIAAARRTG